MPHIHDISAIHVDIGALDSVPEAVVRESCILPVTLGESSLHIIHPADIDASPTIAKLQFILNRNITVDTCDYLAIATAIDQHYPRPGAIDTATDIDLPDSIPQYEHGSEFLFLNLTGRFQHQTTGSVSFDLGRWSHTRFVFSVVGWLDAHFPCTGFHKLFVRCSLPDEYIGFESMRDLIPSVISALELPDSVSYKIDLASSVSATSMEHPQQGFCS